MFIKEIVDIFNITEIRYENQVIEFHTCRCGAICDNSLWFAANITCMITE